MLSDIISTTTLPVSIRTCADETYTERFSSEYGSLLPNPMLKNLGATFKSFAGKSQGHIDKANRELTMFCKFLAQHKRCQELKALGDIDAELLLEYIAWLKTQPLRYQGRGQEGNQWYEKWLILSTALRPFVDEGVIPAVPSPPRKPVEGHTAHAMKMIVKACQKEFDRIRDKLVFREDGTVITKWEDYAARGRVLDLDWLDRMGISSSYGSKLTEEQIDWLEDRWFLNPVDGPDLERSKIAKRFGVKTSYLAGLKQRWKATGIRPSAKPDYECDLTMEDIVATISHYLPQWPVVGRLGMGYGKVRKPHRVYEEERGRLHGEFTKRKDAEAEAETIGGIVISDLANQTDSRYNPAERLMGERRQAESRSKEQRLAQKLLELLPNGNDDLIRMFWPITQDWVTIYIYWICLTGWNAEAVRTVSLVDLRRAMGNSGKHPLSKDHILLSVQIKETKEEIEQNKALATLVGLKRKSQPKDNPKEFCVTCSLSEEYGLYRVLVDHNTLTQPLRKILEELKMAEQHSILVGIGAKATTVTAFGRGDGGQKKTMAAKTKFLFERHKIFEEVNGVRIKSTDAQKLRSTWFTTMHYMGVPLVTQMFLGRHEVIDTTVLSYLSDAPSQAITKSRARKTLNTLADKAFKGELMRYDQHPARPVKGNLIQFHTWRENEFFGCMDRMSPTWVDNEKRLERDDKGRLVNPCSEWRQCLFCKQCLIMKETLPFLLEWQKMIYGWADVANWTDFPLFLQRFLDAIDEVLELCEADAGVWRPALRAAEKKSMTPEFDAPVPWGGM